MTEHMTHSPQQLFEASMAALHVLIGRAGGTLIIDSAELMKAHGQSIVVTGNEEGMVTFRTIDTRVMN